MNGTAVINVDFLTEKYVELRDRKAAIEKKAAEDVAALQVLLKGIENKLKEIMTLSGVTSLKTPHGTAYIAHKDSATVADWEVLLGYIRANQDWCLLERRVSKARVKELMEEDRNGKFTKPPPPGVNFQQFEEVNVRRS
jgi:hypothetical protein